MKAQAIMEEVNNTLDLVDERRAKPADATIKSHRGNVVVLVPT